MTGNKIRLSKCSISELEKEYVTRVLDSEYLGMGGEVGLFESEIREYLGTQMDVVCVSTGTSALHVALAGLGIGPGDEVLVPSLTYVASFQAISAVGATPVACDVNMNSLFIDIEDARSRVSEKTKAIMPVHYASNSSEMNDVYLFAAENGLRVIEDAAQAFGCERGGQKVGVEGDIICFSFDGIKNITSGEGGAILSADEQFIAKVKDIRLLGVQRDTDMRLSGQRSWDFDVTEQGYRYHMSNIFAAIGRAQLNRIDKFMLKRKEIASTYVKCLSDIDEIKFLQFNYSEIIPHIFVIKASKRDLLRSHLIDRNVECGIHYKPCHLLTKFQTSYSLPITEDLYDCILTLPCHYDLSVSDQKIVIDLIREFYNA